MKFAQHQHSTKAREHDETAEPARDVRDAGLEAEVECCLAEIDEALDSEQAERDRAIAEFGEFSAYTPHSELSKWQARYAHLGLRFGQSCCGDPYMYDERK